LVALPGWQVGCPESVLETDSRPHRPHRPKDVGWTSQGRGGWRKKNNPTALEAM